MSIQAANNTTWVIIPAFNESAVIGKVVEDLLSREYNIVVVDDGSKTNLINQLSGITGIHYIRHKVNLGQGAALQTGITYSLQKGATRIVTFDADGQHSPDDLPALLTPLQDGTCDITLGSRFLSAGGHNAGKFRTWTLHVGRWVNFFFTGLRLSDAHNGLRAMSRKAAEKIKLKENRMAHATEILFLIKKHHLKYREVPVTITYTLYSKRKGQSVFNSIRIFFDLVLHKLFE